MTWLLLLLLGIGIFVCLYTLLTFANRDLVYQHWNKIIQKECLYQNETDRAFHNVLSLQSAWICQNEYVRELHRSIFLMHHGLLAKVEEYFQAMLECAEEEKPTAPKRGGLRYFPFRVNCEATSLSLLTDGFNFNQLQPNVLSLGLLIIEPNTLTSWQRASTRGIYRYHYALKLPQEGEYGLHLKDWEVSEELDENIPIHRIKWKDKHGFIWDPTYYYRLSNLTSEPCFLLIADIPRQLSYRYHTINSLLHTYFPHSESMVKQ